MFVLIWIIFSHLMISFSELEFVLLELAFELVNLLDDPFESVRVFGISRRH